jgi:AbiV family abortive infection protein
MAPGAASVSRQELAHGLWYTIEHSGQFLSDAITLFNQKRYLTALLLAVFSNEELGKARRLHDLWDKADKGKSISAAQVKDAIRPKGAHQLKQEAALATSLTSGPATGTEIGRLLRELGLQLKRIHDERIAKGQPAEDLSDVLLSDPRLGQLADELKKARERILYVDFSEATGWLRPLDAFGAEIKDLSLLLIAQVQNNYSNYPPNLLKGGSRLASDLNSWSARPDVPTLPLLNLTQSANVNSPSFEQIQRRAYELFMARGGTHGRDWADWFSAEQELAATSAAGH